MSAIPPSSAAVTADRLVALHDEWQRLWIGANDDAVSDEEAELIADRCIAIEQQIVATPAASIAGLLVKARLAEAHKNIGQPTDPKTGAHDSSRDMIPSLIADLERMAKESRA